MNRQTTHRDTTAADALYEINWRGKLHTFTQQQLDAQPHLWKYARPVQSGDILTFDTDFADDPQPGRLPSSSRRYYMPDAPGGRTRIEDRSYTIPDHTKVPPRRSATQTSPPSAPERQRKSGVVATFRAHPLLTLGIGMLLMFGLWIGGNWLSSWWQVTQDDWHYGRPRTAQYDVLVGHNDDATHLTHIIAVNLNRRVILIELPGGDYSKARIYKGPILLGQGADLAPVTLSFSDSSNTGHPEMLVHVQDATFIYLNQRINGVWQFVTPQT